MRACSSSPAARAPWARSSARFALLMGSATTFDLNGDYNGLITVSNITSAQTVEYSGTSVAGADLTLVHAAPAAGQVFNLELSQNLPDGPGGTLDLSALTVALPVLPPGSVQTVDLHSMGNADNNDITDVSGVDANITVDGATGQVAIAG